MKTLGRCLTLVLLSAVIAAFLLADQWLHGVGTAGDQIVQVVLFTACSGSAAVLIRQIARRTGRGWPTILLLDALLGLRALPVAPGLLRCSTGGTGRVVARRAPVGMVAGTRGSR